MNPFYLLILESIFQFIVFYYLIRIYLSHKPSGWLAFIFAFLFIIFRNLFLLYGLFQSNDLKGLEFSLWNIYINIAIFALFVVGVRNLKLALTHFKEDLFQKSEKKWKSLVEAIPDYITIYDTDGKYLFLNHYAEGFSEKDIEGKYYYDFLMGESIIQMRAAFQRVITTKQTQYIEHSGMGDNRSIRTYNNYLVPICDSDNNESILVISRDITEKKEVEKKLQESQERFEAALTSMADAVFISDENGNFTHFNGAFAKFHRFKNIEECVKTLAEYSLFFEVYEVNGELTLFDNWAVPRALRGETATNVEHILKRKDTQETWFGTYSFAPIRNPEGKIVGSVVTARDINELKNIQKSIFENEHLLQMAYEATEMGVWRHDIVANIFYFNERCQMHHGFNKAEVKFEELTSILHPDDVVELQNAFIQAIGKEGNGKYSRQFRILHKDKGLRWLSIDAFISTEGENENKHPIFAVGTSRDITNQKNAELELEQYKNQLEKLVEERTNQLSQSLEQITAINYDLTQKEVELRSLNKELEAFSYSVSHDLRTPLRGIDGFSNLIAKKFSDLLPEEGQDYFKRIRNASQKMGILIDDLLRLSRISQMQVNKEKVDISELALTISNDLITQEPYRKGDFIIQPGITAFVDKTFIQVALQNLLSNAWKYSRNKEKTKIEFGSFEKENTTVYYIRDNGVGFDMKYSNKLFGAFQRLHSSSEFEGTGIGLATTLRVINKLGGRIWTEAEVDKGATFYFTV